MVKEPGNLGINKSYRDPLSRGSQDDTQWRIITEEHRGITALMQGWPQSNLNSD